MKKGGMGHEEVKKEKVGSLRTKEKGTTLLIFVVDEKTLAKKHGNQSFRTAGTRCSREGIRERHRELSLRKVADRYPYQKGGGHSINYKPLRNEHLPPRQKKFSLRASACME